MEDKKPDLSRHSKRDGGTMGERGVICPVCNKEFEPNMSLQIYCGAKCSTKAHSERFRAWRKLNPVASRPQKSHNCVCPKCQKTHYRAGNVSKWLYCHKCREVILNTNDQNWDFVDEHAETYSVGRMGRMMRGQA